jgi:hypothetical protein
VLPAAIPRVPRLARAAFLRDHHAVQRPVILTAAARHPLDLRAREVGRGASSDPAGTVRAMMRRHGLQAARARYSSSAVNAST